MIDFMRLMLAYCGSAYTCWSPGSGFLGLVAASLELLGSSAVASVSFHKGARLGGHRVEEETRSHGSKLLPLHACFLREHLLEVFETVSTLRKQKAPTQVLCRLDCRGGTLPGATCRAPGD